MKCKNNRTKSIILMFVLLFLLSCTVKKEIITRPEREKVFPEEEYRELIRQGDLYFSKMHVYGWRKAEEFYSKAYGMKQTPELRDKRFLTLCLAAIREKHEKIVNPGVYEKIDALGDFPRNQKQQYLFDIIRHYRTLPVIRKDGQRVAAKEKKQVDVTLFDLENSPLDVYLYIFCLDYYTYDLKVYNEELIELLKKHRIFDLMDTYSMSPLFIYFNYNNVAGKEFEVEEQYPRFAEFLIFRGNKLFSDNRLRQASKYYKKVLDLIPDYTKAINGMGNIYYFTIKDYEKAVEYYQKTLDLDAFNPVALFGKGVSLHYLGKYEESNRVFDCMLENQDMHHGEAYYYKAYNRYLTGEPAEARALIEKAKSLLPHSGEVFFLSGLLYYNGGKLKEADKDFLRTLYDREYSPCYPLYYLGMIKLKNKNWSFLRDFSDSIRSFENAVLNMEREGERIDLLNIEEHQKEWMKERQRLKLEDFKKSSQVLIGQMKAAIDKNKDKKKAYDMQQADAELKRVTALLAKEPGRLNAGDAEGSTLLHKAVEKGQQGVVELLLARGAKLNIKDNSGYTPLHWAVMLDRNEIARLLVHSGAGIDAAGGVGMTPLHEAAYGGKKELVKLLIEKGARLDAKDEMGNTPLDLAIERKHKEVLVYLKPLHMAVSEGKEAAFREALQNYSFQLNTGDEDGRTPLHLAAAKGKNSLAWMLIEKGAQVNARDIDGFTPLELAYREGHNELARMLLMRGAAVPNKEMLEKKPGENEAVLWYMGGHGWAVKTGNHFLIFDFRPLPYNLLRKPKTPLLANGQLNPLELKNQQIVFFITYESMNVDSQGMIFNLEKSVKNITYISNRQFRKGANHVTLAPGEKKHIAGLEITTTQSAGSGSRLGYMVKADGLLIFYSSNHGAWDETWWDGYVREIDYLKTKAGERAFDIVFLPVLPGAEQKVNTTLEKGIFYAADRLQAKVFFPLIEEGDEDVGLAFAKKAAGQNIGTRVYCPKRRGDRFYFRKGKIE